MGQLQPYDLRANHLLQPLGLDVQRLVFSWRCPSIRQSACQILLRNAPDGEPVWDTGRIETDSPMIAYAGPALSSKHRLWWRVRLWDEANTPGPWSEAAWLETPPAEGDWAGPWVAMEGMLTPLYRCEVNVAPGSAGIARARWYVACGGLFEAHLNGQRLGEHVLTPDHTDYAHHTIVTTFDVGDGLQPGPNVLGIVLGGGWYERHGYGRRCFRSQLEVTLTDGRALTLATVPRDWAVLQGPWLAEDIVHGEWYDARLEPADWDRPGFVADASWHPLGRSFGRPANAAEPPGGLLVGQQSPGIRVHQEVRPVETRRVGEHAILVDFERNFAGWVKLTGQAAPGTAVTVRMGELLDEHGRLSQITNKGARGVNGFTFRGEGVECWHPCFSYQGFRFAEVQGRPRLPDSLEVVGLAVGSDCPRHGRFETSHAGLNTLFEMTMRTIESNMFSLLSDCPQRDERQGWLADAWAVSPVVLTWFDSLAFYRKWMDDMAAIQDPRTSFRWSPTAPPCPQYVLRPSRQASRHRLGEAIASQPQSDSVYTAGCTIIPWQYFQATGEPGLLERFYPLVAAHLGAMSARADFPILGTSWHGDHGAMGWTMDPPAATTPIELVTAAIFLQELRIGAAMADRLGLTEDARRWEALTDVSARALADRFYDRAAGSFGSQGADGMALDLGFAPTDHCDRILQALLADLRQRGGRLTSGVVCTPYVLRALSACGAIQAAFDAVTTLGEPGLLWMAERGWTTLGEHLVSNWPDLSRNQPAWGLVCEWMLRDIAGVRRLEPGYRRVRVSPQLPEGVDWVEADLCTVRGEVHVRCRRTKTGVHAEARADAGIAVHR